jgi:hypothetical protein
LSGPASLGGALRTAAAAYLEWPTRFLLVNAVWLVAALLVLFALRVPALVILAPFLAPAACAMTGMAAAAVRERRVGMRAARDGVRQRFWAKLGLGAAQLLLLVLALADLNAAAALGGAFGAISALLAFYVGAAVSAYALVAWPLLCDPLRAEQPVRALLRVALAVFLAKALPVLALLLLVAMAAWASVQLVVPALFRPALLILAVTAYALPAADELSPPVAEEEE